MCNQSVAMARPKNTPHSQPRRDMRGFHGARPMSRVSPPRSRRTTTQRVDVGDWARAYRALGHPVRLGLLMRLSSRGPQSTNALIRSSEISRQGLMKQLHALSAAGLIRGSVRYRAYVWEVEPERVGMLCGHLQELSRHWDQAVRRVKCQIEKMYANKGRRARHWRRGLRAATRPRLG